MSDFGNSFKNITTNTTTAVSAASGRLHAVIINQKGASSNTITLYDNTAGSGTIIGTIDSTVSIGTLAYHANFKTGLTVVTATGTAPNITVVWE